MQQNLFEIYIQNQVKGARPPVRSLKEAARRMLKLLGWKRAVLSVLLVDDRKIRTLHRRYLGHDRPTDVMAFSQLEASGPKGRRPGGAPYPKNGPPVLGDIVISLPTTRRQALFYGNSFSYELHFYLCHGILHLMGYDDKTKKQAQEMEKMQTEILEKLRIR